MEKGKYLIIVNYDKLDKIHKHIRCWMRIYNISHKAKIVDIRYLSKDEVTTIVFNGVANKRVENTKIYNQIHTYLKESLHGTDVAIMIYEVGIDKLSLYRTEGDEIK